VKIKVISKCLEMRVFTDGDCGAEFITTDKTQVGQLNYLPSKNKAAATTLTSEQAVWEVVGTGKAVDPLGWHPPSRLGDNPVMVQQGRLDVEGPGPRI
jgi:hypothetical protein